MREVYLLPTEPTLPIHSHSTHILSQIHTNKVTIIQAETGCGKTTVVPRICLQDALNNQQLPRIIVCQPRRVACLSICKRVSSQLSTTSFSAGHRIMNNINDPNANILFSTTGYLVQWLSKNPNVLEKCTHVVLDEAHERSVDMDLLALILRRGMRDAKFKLVIMSATLDVDVFSTYFGSVQVKSVTQEPVKEELDELVIEFNDLELKNNENNKDIPVLHVGVKRFHVEHMFLETIQKSPSFAPMFARNGEAGTNVAFYIATKIKTFNKSIQPPTATFTPAFLVPVIEPLGFLLGVLLVTHWAGMYIDESFAQENDDPIKYDTETGEIIHFSPPSRGLSILIFLPGENEILEWMDTFEEYFSSHSKRSKVKILVLHSMVKSEEQDDIFVDVMDGWVKIILSTNIAESSITIPDVKYIIDYGLRRAMEYNTVRGIQQLTLGWGSRASAIQRIGRAGRCDTGIAVNIFTQKFLESRPHHDPPEIMQIALEGVVLRLKDIFGGEKVREVLRELVEPPDEQQIEIAFTNLIQTGAIVSTTDDDDDDGDITFFGRLSLGLPIDQIHSRIILFGQATGLSCEGCILAAALSCLDIFTLPSAFHLRDRNELLIKLAQSFAGRYIADNNTYSDPIAYYNTFKSYISLPKHQRQTYLRAHAIHAPRFRQFLLTVSLLGRKLREIIKLEIKSMDYSTVRSLKSLDELTRCIENCQSSYRESEGLDEQVLGSCLSDDVERLRGVLLLGCGGQLVVGKVDCENGNRQYDAAVKEFQKMGIEKESKKKKKKIKDKEIRKLESEITKSLFDHSSTPSKNSSKKPQKFDRNLDIFHQLIPECVFEQPTAWNKNQSDTCMTISCAESVEDEYKPFDMTRTILINFHKTTNPQHKDAEFIRSQLSVMGVERVVVTSKCAILEFQTYPIPLSSVFRDGSEVVGLGISFLRYSTSGRDFVTLPPSPRVFDGKDEAGLGFLIPPSKVVWNGDGFLVGSPPIKLNWRTPLNDLMFSKFVEFEHTSVGGILGCVASTLALSNGQSFSVSVSGVTLIPIHKRAWQMRVLAISGNPMNPDITVQMSNPETIRSVKIGTNIDLDLQLSKKDLEKINTLRQSINNLLLHGHGFIMHTLTYHLFDQIDDSPPPDRITSRRVVVSSLKYVKEKTVVGESKIVPPFTLKPEFKFGEPSCTTEFKFGESKNVPFNFRSTVNPTVGEFKFGESKNVPFNFSSTVKTKEEEGDLAGCLYKKFAWPEYVEEEVEESEEERVWGEDSSEESSSDDED